MFFNVILPGAIALSTIFLFGCTGEIIMEKAGHLNLGIPGIMCFGCFGGCFGISIYMGMVTKNGTDPIWILLILFMLLFSALFSIIPAAIYGLLTVTFKCNQNVTGLALTTFGAGFIDYFIHKIDKSQFTIASKLIRAGFPFASKLGAFGSIFFDHSVLTYLAIAIAVASGLILSKTKLGLNLRSVGENPATADAAGINVAAYKYGAIGIGSIISGFGGVFYVMCTTSGAFENSGTIQAFGWLAIALVIFIIWKPTLGIAGSIVFALFYILYNYIPGSPISKESLKLLPYLMTVLVLIITSILGKQNVMPPEALGLPYYREDR